MTHKRNDGKTIEKDEARTPANIFEILDSRYHFTIDVAVSLLYNSDGEPYDTNSLCDEYVYVSDNHLGFLDSTLHLTKKDIAYCNPPYSRGNIEAFCKKAYEESISGAVVVMLLPMDSSTQWFHKYCSKAYKWIIFAPRVKFLHPNGIPFDGSPKFGSFACVFDEAGRRSISSPVIEFARWK